MTTCKHGHLVRTRFNGNLDQWKCFDCHEEVVRKKPSEIIREMASRAVAALDTGKLATLDDAETTIVVISHQLQAILDYLDSLHSQGKL